MKTKTIVTKPNWKLLVLIHFLFIGSYLLINTFIHMSRKMAADGFQMLDQKAADFALTMRSPELTSFFLLITSFGNWRVLLTLFVLLTLIFAIYRKQIKTPLIVGGIISGAGVAMYILKDIFDRQRPSMDVLVNARLSSFPSGHAMLSVVFYGFVIILLCKWIKNPRLKLVLRTLLVLLILIICWSRVYLGAHFFSDVLAGIIAGLGWLSMAWLAYFSVKLYKKRTLVVDTTPMDNVP